jgi:hypothetical protein
MVDAKFEAFKTIRQHAKDKKKKLLAILDQASAENRDLNEQEAAQYDEELKALANAEKWIECADFY